MSEELNCNIYFKHENRQRTGSFKLRGAHNKISKLDKNKTFITSSTGNHGLGCIDAMNKYGAKGQVVVLKCISEVKKQKLLKLGADLVYYDGTDCEQSEEYAKQLANQSAHIEYISPYNDPEIIAGQGTIGLEILSDLPEIDIVFVSVGGGGLISGIAGYLKSMKPGIQIIGCQPLASPVMLESIKAGEIIEMESLPTLSEGTAGGIEKGSITFSICRELVDDWIVINEDDIRKSLELLRNMQEPAEGAAALALAAAKIYIKEKEIRDQNVCVVLCGGNASA